MRFHLILVHLTENRLHILDIFRTEFQLRFLFGDKGALRESAERHTKFQQILNALSSHCESCYESAV